MDGEERERHALATQIERAKAQEALRLATETAAPDAGLLKKDGEKITLTFQAVSVGPSGAGKQLDPQASGTLPVPASISFGAATPSSSTHAINPLKRPASTNVFKTAKQPKIAKTEDGDVPVQAPKKYTSEAERLMKEDQARKAGKGGIGPVRTSKPNLGRTY
jgi:DNA/RNA-binding protein KIN17